MPESGLVLTLGNYPLTRPKYELCSNMIRIKEDQRLRVTIQSLNPNCFGKISSDWIEIHDYNQNRSLIRKRLCEEAALKPFTSMSNELFIRFDSQTYGVRTGYTMTIERGMFYPLNEKKMFSLYLNLD